jgi:Fic family protein
MYNDITQFEPLVPQQGIAPLVELAEEIIRLSSQLKPSLHPTVAQTLSSLLREINSYYSNQIEGYRTHPADIVRGLQHDFSKSPQIAKLQRLALAHIEAEIEIESWLEDVNPTFNPLSVTGICRIHTALYNQLSEEDRSIEDNHIVEPGVLRTMDVKVGQHVAPSASSLAAYLHRYENFYTQVTTPAKQLILIASSHHRLAWIHPFLDGNGRVARLASHAALYSKYNAGLWSICRGLARTQQEYYAKLARADSLRRGDLDGRGHLSESGLVDFCHYFLSICLDQIIFMKKMLNVDEMRKRITALIIYRSQFDKQIRSEAILPLHYLFTGGPLTRGEFKKMTGLGDKVAQNLVAALLKNGLLTSDTPLGPVRFGLPLEALQFYFPDLYPEARMANTS